VPCGKKKKEVSSIFFEFNSWIIKQNVKEEKEIRILNSQALERQKPESAEKSDLVRYFTIFQKIY
jgi:hypothetical protein